ncbi:unnamed protein product [Protopolystoma xenopodis]|uniref:Uncharacterized protein n=1 Tax=Protopolystoma xenopodis TaxID=117903 RepID=A0A3S5CL11_9PLAT|nr:unnamed protein product [Protopolystoma xenopodis]
MHRGTSVQLSSSQQAGNQTSGQALRVHHLSTGPPGSQVRVSGHGQSRELNSPGLGAGFAGGPTGFQAFSPRLMSPGPIGQSSERGQLGNARGLSGGTSNLGLQTASSGFGALASNSSILSVNTAHPVQTELGQPGDIEAFSGLGAGGKHANGMTTGPSDILSLTGSSQTAIGMPGPTVLAGQPNGPSRLAGSGNGPHLVPAKDVS